MCDCVVALDRATARGTTLFGKNSDREKDEAQPVRSFPQAEHAAGVTVRCTYIEVPQVRETAAVLGTGPFWCWGLEQGLNEHGVVIGNNTVFTHEELELPDEGLLGMDLLRLGLERARTARQAVEIIAELIERFGQGGKGWMHIPLAYSNAFLIADREEAWTLQTSSRRWAARRITDLGATSNQLSIEEDWDLLSEDAERFAVDHGWWSPESGRLNFKRAYRSTRLLPPVFSEGRLRRSTALLEAARGQTKEADVFALLRDHGGTLAPAAAERDQEAYFTLCAHNEVQGDTTASMVVALDRPICWTALGSPCTSPYLPLLLEGQVPPELMSGGKEPDGRSAWWAFKRLQQHVEEDFGRLARVRDAFDPLEAEWLSWAAPLDAPTERMAEATARALETCHSLLRELGA
ncbi:MAG: C69 family dipeptidase [Myxococcota bacterium]